MQRIEMLNGSKEFCQEFMTDLRVPDAYRVGGVDMGWTPVGSRWMYFERMGRNSPLVTAPDGERRSSGAGATMHAIARASGRLGDARARELIGEAHTLELVGSALKGRVAEGIKTDKISYQAAAIVRLFVGLSDTRRTTIAFDLAGSAGGAWADGDGDLAEWGIDYLMRQASCIGGGTTEMAMNVISERVLDMPKEPTPDKDAPFRDVPRNRTSQG
jgi:alkylation response protein AidB-like acyl-CoA dehydrogenase